MLACCLRIPLNSSEAPRSRSISAFECLAGARGWAGPSNQAGEKYTEGCVGALDLVQSARANGGCFARCAADFRS